MTKIPQDFAWSLTYLGTMAAEIYNSWTCCNLFKRRATKVKVTLDTQRLRKLQFVNTIRKTYQTIWMCDNTYCTTGLCDPAPSCAPSIANLLQLRYQGSTWVTYPVNPSSSLFLGHSELAPTSAPWRMNGKWWGNSFLLGSSSLANHGG